MRQSASLVQAAADAGGAADASGAAEAEAVAGGEAGDAGEEADAAGTAAPSCASLGGVLQPLPASTSERNAKVGLILLLRPRASPEKPEKGPESCGAEGDRTPDLIHAMDALSQLSYGPESSG